MSENPFADATEADLGEAFEATDYVAGDDIVTTVLLALGLGRPLLIEGEPGAGKAELAKVLAEGFDTDLVWLQCYEGLTAENTLYEWNYTKQLLAVQGDERGVADDCGRPPVLLIDEIDRADEEHAGAVDRRTAVLILSDGLETGDVTRLETGMAWLSPTAATVLWLNPLATAPDDEPVADGMAAALPSVDGLFAFAGPDDIEELTRQLSRHGSGGRIGFEHDPRRVRSDQP